MHYDNMSTPEGLKAARKALGMKNQAELAAALGVHEITVAKWESGARIDLRTALAVECLLRRRYDTMSTGG